MVRESAGNGARVTAFGRGGGGYLGSVAEVRRATAADADAVWAVLAGGWRLAAWVVGAARVDAVDPGWPAVGAELAYRIGGWPATLPGVARVTGCRAGRALGLHGSTPFGGVDLQAWVEPTPGGCTLVLREDVVSGPGHLVPPRLRAAVITARNVETLRRLALLAGRGALG